MYFRPSFTPMDTIHWPKASPRCPFQDPEICMEVALSVLLPHKNFCKNPSSQRKIIRGSYHVPQKWLKSKKKNFSGQRVWFLAHRPPKLLELVLRFAVILWGAVGLKPVSFAKNWPTNSIFLLFFAIFFQFSHFLTLRPIIFLWPDGVLFKFVARKEIIVKFYMQISGTKDTIFDWN